MKIKTYPYPSREAWIADRPNFIGASEVASVIGAPGAYCSRWELWARKSGKLPEKPETESMRWGSILEAAIARGVQAEHGGYVTLSYDGDAAYGPEDKPHQRATPDCSWLRGEVDWLLEIKNVDRMLAEHWDDAPPPHVVVQLQWQMYCCGYEKAAVAALIGGNRLVLHEAGRDQELIDALIVAVDDFWQEIQDGREPTAEARDVNLLPLRWQARQDTVAELPYLDARALLEADRARKQADEVFKTRKALLMQQMGGATEGHVDGEAVVTWRPDKNGKRVLRITARAESVLDPQLEREAS